MKPVWLINFFKTCVSAGVSPKHSRSRNTSISTFNSILLWAALTNILFIFIECISGNMFLFYVNIALLTSYAIAFYLNHRGHSKPAVSLAICMTVMNIFFSTDSLGQESNVHLFLIATIVAPFASLELKNLKTILSLSSVAGASFLLIYLLPDQSFTPASVIEDATHSLIPVVVTPLIIAAMFFKAIRMHGELLDEAEQVKIERFRQSRMAAMGEMASGIAHEVNNPLQIIASNAFSIQQKISKPTPDLTAISSMAQRIEDTSYKIGKIVTGLLKFSRGETNQTRELESVAGIVNGSLDLCQEKLKSHQIVVRGIFLEDCDLYVRSTQISQVLINLIGNAMDALAGHPDPWIEIHGRQEKSIYRLEVHDNAGPIPADIVEKMMQPFFSTKPVGKGTGLGLSISKGIIEEHGGKFYYQDGPGISKFIIELPRTTD